MLCHDIGHGRTFSRSGVELLKLIHLAGDPVELMEAAHLRGLEKSD